LIPFLYAACLLLKHKAGEINSPKRFFFGFKISQLTRLSNIVQYWNWIHKGEASMGVGVWARDWEREREIVPSALDIIKILNKLSTASDGWLVGGVEGFRGKLST